jgi:hypothetical protein
MSEMKGFVDGLSVSALGAALMGWLPHLAVAATAVWAVFRVYDISLAIKLKRAQLRAYEQSGK